MIQPVFSHPPVRAPRRRARVRRLLAAALLAALATALAPALGPAAGAQEVLLTPEQALREIFPEGARSTTERRRIDPVLGERLARELGRPLEAELLEVQHVYDAAGAFRGYAVVTEEVGKYRPITFMVGVTPDFRVRDVAVLVYRESRGGDVKRKRFLAQYRGKSARDPIDTNRDIINISGATISVRSMNVGVKRVLAQLAVLYGAASTAAR